MSKSLLLIGTTLPDRLEGSYARAFEKLGWVVNRWYPVEALHRVARGNRFGRLFSTFVNVEPWVRKANLELIELAKRLSPYLILVIGTEGVLGGTLAQVRVLSPQTLIYCVYPDSPHNLDLNRIHCLPFFDLVTASSPAWTGAFERLGARIVRYLPFAADTDLHSPVGGHASLQGGTHDVAFIGNWRPEREDLLENLVNFNLRIWGSDYWKSRTRQGSPLRSCWGGRRITGDEFAQVCARTKVLLNIMDAPTWPGPNMRTFEQPACRAFSLVTRTPAVADMFTEGETIECFDSVEEARDKVRFYLNNEAARQRVAQASYRYVVEGGHTYVDRAKQLAAWAEEDRAKL